MKSSRKKLVYIHALIGRIGHLALEMFYLRNIFNENEFKTTVITYPSRFAANNAVYEIVMRGVNVIHSTDQKLIRSGIYNLDPLRRDFFTRFHQREPIFNFSLLESEIEKGNQLRDSFNIPRTAPIVTLHVREPGYLTHLTYHSYRDNNIQNYVSAIKYLIERGFYVVRLGDKTMKPAIVPPPQLIDAPFHPAYSDFVDPYFIAMSKFYVGAASGPLNLAQGFGIPVLHTNCPIQADIWGNKNDLLVFKKYYSHELGRYLTYEEIILSSAPGFNTSEEFEQAGIQVIENSPEEILLPVKEMNARLNGTYSPAPEFEEINQRLRIIHESAHYYHKEFANPNKIPYRNYYALYGSNAQISHEYIKANPWFLAHDWQGVGERDAVSRLGAS